MAAFNKFQITCQNFGRGVMNLNSDVSKVALSNTTVVNTNQTLSNITQISSGGGYTTGGDTVPNTAYSQSSGTATFIGDSITWTGSGGGMGPFQYVVIYDDTPTSPADPLVGWWDYGSAISLAAGETFQWKPNNASTGGSILTLA